MKERRDRAKPGWLLRAKRLAMVFIEELCQDDGSIDARSISTQTWGCSMKEWRWLHK